VKPAVPGADRALARARHLTALTLNQLNTRSLFGTFEISDAESKRVIRSGVHVFLLAYGPRG
jgi:hypothetical protein